jgi:hypothetical protein
VSDDVPNLAAMLAASDERSIAAARAYELLRQRRKLRSHRLLTYWCRHRCLLLDVLRTPSGLLLYSPRYKLSPALNAQSSSDSGRAKHTEDGARRWKSRAYFARDAVNFTVNCDHVRLGVIEKSDVEADVAAGLTEVVFPHSR